MQSPRPRSVSTRRELKDVETLQHRNGELQKQVENLQHRVRDLLDQNFRLQVQRDEFLDAKNEFKGVLRGIGIRLASN